MAATFAATLSSGGTSSEITTTPNAIFSVQASHPVDIESKRTQGTDGWHLIGRTEHDNQSRVVVATGETARIVNRYSGDNDIEVYV